MPWIAVPSSVENWAMSRRPSPAKKSGLNGSAAGGTAGPVAQPEAPFRSLVLTSFGCKLEVSQPDNDPRQMMLEEASGWPQLALRWPVVGWTRPPPTSGPPQVCRRPRQVGKIQHSALRPRQYTVVVDAVALSRVMQLAVARPANQCAWR